MADRILREGMSGGDVTVVRELLAQHLVAARFSVARPDVFDSQLTSLVKVFQGAKRLAVDGVVGPRTWAALRGVTITEIDEESDGEPLVPQPTSNTSLFLVGALAVGAFFFLRRS